MTKKLEFTHLRGVHSRRYLQICDLVNELTGFDSAQSSYVGREDNAWKLLVRLCKEKSVYGSVQEIEKFSDSEIVSYLSSYTAKKKGLLGKLKSWFYSLT